MKFLFSELKSLSLEEICSRFVLIPYHVEEIIIEGDFQKKSYFESSFFAEALSYLPLQVRTIGFAGQFHYARHQWCLTNPGRYTRHLGDYLAIFTAAVPKHIETLKFSLHRDIEFEAQGHMIDSAVANEFAAIWTRLPTSVHRLDLSETSFDEPYEDNNILHMYTSFPHSIRYLHLHQFDWGLYPQFHRDMILSYCSRNLEFLSFAGHQVLKRFSTKLSSSFSSLYIGNKLKSLDFSFNHFDEIPFERLKVFFQGLPQHIEQLNFSGNGLAKIPRINDLIKLLPKKLISLNIANNGLMYLAVDDFFSLCRAIPNTVRSLALFDPIDDSQQNLVRQNYELIPSWVNELSFSQAGAKVLQRIESLPPHIHALNLAQNQIFTMERSELILLFQHLPKTINYLNLAQNQLMLLPSTVAATLMSALPPHIKEVNLEKNGLIACEPTRLHAWLRALPDRLYRLDQDSLRLGHDGQFFHIGSRQPDTYFKPVSRIRLQNQASRFLLVMGQMARQKHLSAQILFSVCTYLCEQACDSIHLESLCRKSLGIISSKLTPSFVDIFNLLKVRLSQQKDGYLDLSFCGMHVLKLEKDFKQLFWMIPKTVVILNLRHNSLNHCSKTFAAFAQALKHLPASIRYLDLSANGFAQESSIRLGQKFANLPVTIQYLQLGHQRPVSLRATMDRLLFPSHFYQLYARPSALIDKIVALLNDYSQSNSRFKRLVYGYWNRRHLPEVNRLLFWIAKGYLTEIQDILQHINLLNLANESGALAKISSFLYLEDAKTKEPIRIGLQ